MPDCVLCVLQGTCLLKYVIAMSKAGAAAASTVGLVFILTTTSRLFPSNFHTLVWQRTGIHSTEICTSNYAVSELTVINGLIPDLGDLLYFTEVNFIGKFVKICLCWLLY